MYHQQRTIPAVLAMLALPTAAKHPNSTLGRALILKLELYVCVNVLKAL
jgi:hypothetical protein